MLSLKVSQNIICFWQRPTSTNTDENIELLEQVFAQNQGKSSQAETALELSINKSAIPQMFLKVMMIYSYRLQDVETLQAEDHGACLEMCESFLFPYQNNHKLLENFCVSD